jgi:hypothetical protein
MQRFMEINLDNIVIETEQNGEGTQSEGETPSDEITTV